MPLEVTTPYTLRDRPSMVRLPRELRGIIEPDLEMFDGIDIQAYRTETHTGLDPAEVMADAEADFAFDEIKGELTERVDKFLPALYSKGYSETERAEVLDREESFFTKTVAAMLTMAEKGDGPVVMLLDVDFTVLHSEIVKDGPASSTPRPALLMALRTLRERLGDRLKVGLVTTRPEKGPPGNPVGLEDELAEPTYTAAFADLLDRDFVVSTGPWDRPDNPVYDLAYGPDEDVKLLVAEDVIGPENTADIKAGKLDIRKYDSKLIALQTFLDKYPNHAFVMVDDLPFVQLIRTDNQRVKGIHVRAEALNRAYQPLNIPVKTVRHDADSHLEPVAV